MLTKFYNKRDDFNFPILNFPFICSNITTAPAYGVHLSVDPILLLLTRKLLYQRLLVVDLKQSIRKFQHHDMVNRYGIYVSLMTFVIVKFRSSSILHNLSTKMIYHQIVNITKTTGATCGAGISETYDFALIF